MDLTLIAREGVFAAADAARVGLDKNALGRLVRDGCCLRLAVGWYAIAEEAPPDREQLHRLRSIAFGRQFRTRAALSHHSRLVLAGLPTYAAPFDTVHLTAWAPAAGGVSVSRPGVKIHRQVAGLHLPAADVAGRIDRHRPRAVPVAYAAVQAGLLAGPQAFLVAADAALRAEAATATELSRAVSVFAKHTGIAPVRSALSLVDPRHESPGESRTAFVLSALGFELEPQFEVVAEGRRYRADFRIRGTRVLVEFDGAVKYADGDRRVLFDEKRREDALRRDGWVVVRLVWVDLSDPDGLRRRVVAACALAA